jgi:hypothetical protein
MVEDELPTSTRRDVVALVGVVLAVDVIFVVAYFLMHVRNASNTSKLVFTAVWTLAVLIVAARGLTRIRSSRLSAAGKGPPS